MVTANLPKFTGLIRKAKQKSTNIKAKLTQLKSHLIIRIYNKNYIQQHSHLIRWLCKSQSVSPRRRRASDTLFRPRAFVRISAGCWVVGMWCTWIRPECTMSRSLSHLFRIFPFFPFSFPFRHDSRHHMTIMLFTWLIFYAYSLSPHYVAIIFLKV